MTNFNLEEIKSSIDSESQFIDQINDAIHQIIIGQDDLTSSNKLLQNNV